MPELALEPTLLTHSLTWPSHHALLPTLPISSQWTIQSLGPRLVAPGAELSLCWDTQRAKRLSPCPQTLDLLINMQPSTQSEVILAGGQAQPLLC